MHIGLTGLIGSGKSSVLSFFKLHGWETFNADEFCRTLHQNPGSIVVKQIQKRWGNSYLQENGTSNRAKIAELIFNDKNEREWLNSIIHPLVLEAMQEKAKKYENLISEVPLLFEVGWQNKFDVIIAIWSPIRLILARLKQRNISENLIFKMMNAHFSQEKKLELAHFAFINSYTLDFLHVQCFKFLTQSIIS